MSVKLPEEARNVLSNPDDFMKRDAEVVTRLLNCQDAGFIKAFYSIDKNIGESLYSKGSVWSFFLLLLVEHSTDFQKGKKKEITDAKNEYIEKLSAIADTSKQLSMQIKAADKLGEKYGFYNEVDVNPISLLKNTVNNQVYSETRYRFNHWIADKLDKAILGFDLKYFPRITDVIDEIERQYSSGFEISAEAMTPMRAGKINLFWMHFSASVEHNIKSGLLPSNIFAVSNSMIADILRISLGDESITEQNIKDTIGRKNKK